LKAAEKQASIGQQGDRESHLDADEEPFRPDTCDRLVCAREPARLLRVPRMAGNSPQIKVTATEQQSE
jgi:hypothetical protein